MDTMILSDPVKFRFIDTLRIGEYGRLLEIYAPYVEETAISFEYVAPSVKEFQKRISTIMQRYPYLVAEENGMVIGYP